MRILVQKFGGTSLSTSEARTKVVSHIRRELERKYKIVVVVSAMGRRGEPYATDTLLDWITENGNHLPMRERDMLLSCGEMISAATLCSLLHSVDISATVLTGAQAGIQTDSQFANARILNVKPQRIIDAWQQHEIVIVTGYQGQNEFGDVTTLGRGGSDTSATALGVALQAEIIDIYTDVDGILTADPRLVSDAKPLALVSYAEMCNLAHYGAKVIHPRAVEIAMQAQIPIRVRSTFSEQEGTLVTNPEGFRDLQPGVMDRFVTGIAYVANVTQITVLTEGTITDLQLQVFKEMAKHEISVDFINVTPSGAVYTVLDVDAARAAIVLQAIGFIPTLLSGCAKVSVIGGGINGVPGIMAHIVEALTEQDIQILQSADSNTTIWILVRKEDLVPALQALHTKFNLHR